MNQISFRIRFKTYEIQMNKISQTYCRSKDEANVIYQKWTLEYRSSHKKYLTVNTWITRKIRIKNTYVYQCFNIN